MIWYFTWQAYQHRRDSIAIFVLELMQVDFPVVGLLPWYCFCLIASEQAGFSLGQVFVFHIKRVVSSNRLSPALRSAGHTIMAIEGKMVVIDDEDSLPRWNYRYSAR
jgi:hypothetical protein